MYYEGYRGQHGTSKVKIHTRLPSITFSSMDAAYLYATEPNDRKDTVLHPMVLKAKFRIDNPLFVADDCFIELGQIADKLGVNFAWETAIKHEEEIYYTSNWMENFAEKYRNVEAMMEDDMSLINDLYFDAFRALDDEEFIDWALACGYDGAIHTGNGDTAGVIEYRIFTKKQILKLETVPLEECEAA